MAAELSGGKEAELALEWGEAVGRRTMLLVELVMKDRVQGQHCESVRLLPLHQSGQFTLTKASIWTDFVFQAPKFQLS